MKKFCYFICALLLTGCFVVKPKGTTRLAPIKVEQTSSANVDLFERDYLRRTYPQCDVYGLEQTKYGKRYYDIYHLKCVGKQSKLIYFNVTNSHKK